MRFLVHQTATIMLAMDLDKDLAELTQQADTGGLVIDVDAGTAILTQASPQDHGFIRLNINAGIRENGLDGVASRQSELSRCASLTGAGPHLCSISAFTERQPESTEKNGFACTGLTGKRAQSTLEGRIKRVDQDHIAD
jgi:hypothetical protein